MNKLVGILLVAVIAIITALNINQSENGAKASDLTLDNLEAIAQGRGIFPACQKREGTKSPAQIDFCVENQCKKVYTNRGTLDVNYCSEDPK